MVWCWKSMSIMWLFGWEKVLIRYVFSFFWVNVLWQFSGQFDVVFGLFRYCLVFCVKMMQYLQMLLIQCIGFWLIFLVMIYLILLNYLLGLNFCFLVLVCNLVNWFGLVLQVVRVKKVWLVGLFLRLVKYLFVRYCRYFILV